MYGALQRDLPRSFKDLSGGRGGRISAVSFIGSKPRIATSGRALLSEHPVCCRGAGVLLDRPRSKRPGGPQTTKCPEAPKRDKKHLEGFFPTISSPSNLSFAAVSTGLAQQNVVGTTPCNPVYRRESIVDDFRLGASGFRLTQAKSFGRLSWGLFSHIANGDA